MAKGLNVSKQKHRSVGGKFATRAKKTNDLRAAFGKMKRVSGRFAAAISAG